MRYYSEELKKFYDTEAECIKAEADAKKLEEEKENRKREVDEAVKRTIKLLKQYNKDYKEAYSVEIDKNEIDEPLDLSDLLSTFRIRDLFNF